MTEDHWIKNAAGVYVPPKEEEKHVQKAEFAVKVTGFAAPIEPPKKPS